MKKAQNGFIKNLHHLCLVGVIALGLITVVGTGGGDGDGGSGTTVSTITVTGTVGDPNRITSNTSGIIDGTPESGAPVRVVRPGTNGWTNVSTDYTITTDSNGKFSITVDDWRFSRDCPYYVAASDMDGTWVQLSTIPKDQITAGATVDMVVDRTTTVAALMHCPGGVYPPISMGAYCYSDPTDASSLETLSSSIDSYFSENTVTTTDVKELLASATSDSTVMATYNNILAEKSIPSRTASEIIDDNNSGDPLPLVTYEDDTTPDTSTGVDCNNPPTGWGSSWWSEYESWCIECGGTPDVSTTTCTPGPNWGQ